MATSQPRPRLDIRFKEMAIRFSTISFLLFSVFAAGNSYAATFTVTKIEDTNDGVCDSDCSLREAVGTSASGDTIVFSELFNSPHTITLMLGDMAFTKDLAFIGTGRDNVVVSANNSGTGIFYITGGAHVSITGMSFRDGNVGQQSTTDALGGAIRLGGSTLNVTDASLTNNRAFNSQAL